MTRKWLGPTGFTLVEVLVGLVIGAMVVLLAHRLLAQLVTGMRASSEAAQGLDREQNAERFLKALLLSVEVGGDAGSFEGGMGDVVFPVRRLSAEGWFVRDQIHLGLNRGRVEATGRGAAVVLWDSVTTFNLDYLLAHGGNSPWIRTWSSPVTAPVALRLRIGRRSGDSQVVDTLLFLIKGRG